MSQNADTVKVGAVVSDTRPRLRPHRVTDPTLPKAVTSAPLQSVSLAHELPYIKRVLAAVIPKVAPITRLAEAGRFHAASVKTHPCEEDGRLAERPSRAELRRGAK